MPDSVQSELNRMRAILQELEARLEAGEVPAEGLPEFKSTVDGIRMRVWSLLAAAGSGEPRATAERFRLRRAAEVCHTLAHELNTGSLGASYSEWLELQHAAAELHAAIAEHAGRAA